MRHDTCRECGAKHQLSYNGGTGWVGMRCEKCGATWAVGILQVLDENRHRGTVDLVGDVRTVILPKES